MSSPEESGPIAAATAKLVGWLADVSGGPVHAGPPEADATQPAGLSAYALALLPEQELRGPVGRQPFRFHVRFLVTARGSAEQAARLLDQVLVASVESVEVTVHLKPMAPELWTALGARPQPAVLVDLPAAVARRAPVVPRVRTPLQIRDAALRRLDGRVIGAGDVPLTGVRVEVADTGAATYTSAGGGFSFAAVPADQPVRLLLRAKGREFETRLAQAALADAASDPLVIHCDLEGV